MDVFLAACDGVEEPDPDRAPLDAALAAAGIRAAWPAWSNPNVDWAEARVCFPRATWDYHLRYEEFLAWASHVDSVSALRNPLSIVAWNTDKRYMLELAEAGLACVPTCVVKAGEGLTVNEVREQFGWSRVVIKPAVSCGSWQTFSLSDNETGEPAWSRLLDQRDMLVQPYISSVETLGERSVIVVDGEITHVVRKAPRFEGGVERVTGPHVATDAERTLVEQALSHVGVDLDYARVDVVTDERGEPMIAELELVEPSLYFSFSDVALQRFVGVVERYIQQS